MDNPRPSTCTPAELLLWRENGNLELTPKFQRKMVWTRQQRSYLIDTLLQGMPVPPIYFRNLYNAEERQLVHQVIDGQQRMLAVLDFVDDKYPLSQTLEADYAGSKFSALSKRQQAAIMKFQFTYQAFDEISDTEVYEVFRRMNTFSSPLTRQELRHGRWFGRFSRASQILAAEYLEFWRTNRIITEAKIVRMGEVQFTSSLLIVQIEGMKNKNEEIDRFYADYDEVFPGRAQHEKRFRATMDQISDIFGDSLVANQFRRPPFFYTLFCTVYHRMFGMPNVNATIRTPKKRLTIAEATSLESKVSDLSKVIMVAREQNKQIRSLSPGDGEDAIPAPAYPTRLKGFVQACLSGTDNVIPRTTRFETLYKEAFR